MKAKRAPKSNKATIEGRRVRVIELLKEGKTAPQAAEIVRAEGFPASDVTVRRDFRALAPAWRAGNEQAFDHYRQKQLAELEGLRAELKNDKIKPDRRIDLALSILDREIRLLGTEAPSKAIVGHVRENTTIQNRFLEHAYGLSELQINEVFAFMDSLPRHKVSIADCFPKQVPQLEAGDVPDEEVSQ